MSMRLSEGGADRVGGASVCFFVQFPVDITVNTNKTGVLCEMPFNTILLAVLEHLVMLM